ncbi:MAG: PVC-type heme-binding CxxCH protein [Opitutales bacterium]
MLMLVWAAVAPAAATRLVISSDTRAELQAALGSTADSVSWIEQPRSPELSRAEVLVLHRARAGRLSAESQADILAFVRKGGAVVVIGRALALGDAAWGREVGGAGWVDATRTNRDLHLLNFQSDAHPLTRDVASFNLDCEIVYEHDLDPAAQVLCSAFTPKLGKGRAAGDKVSIYDVQAQVWARDSQSRRVVTVLQGSPAALAHGSIRTLLRRAVAWVSGSTELDAGIPAAQLADLRYPAGGPRRADRTAAGLSLPAGFAATAIAAEPLVRKPIAVQWDGAGRLWVAETPEYPNGRRPLVAESWKEGGSLVPGKYDRPAQDKIVILHDDNGDGRMDRRVVFHEGLELITGFCLHRDGALVVSQGGICWLRDTDGDGKADQRVEVLEGFTPQDTHFVTNHLIQAPDGWVYASTGSGTVARDPVTRRELARLSPGVFRFRPDGSAVEQIASQGGNAFGAEVTSDLEVFHSKATSGNPVQHAVLPEAVLARAGSGSAKAFHSVNPGRRVVRTDMPTRAPYVQVDVVGGFTAACSTLVCEDPAWPAEYRRNVFLAEPILDVIQRELLVPDGPTYRGDPGPSRGAWLRADDEWFMPVALAFAPDGAMLVLDFYSPVVLHNDTRGPLHSRSNAAVRPDREHHYGRLYRITPPGFSSRAVPDLTKADAAGLVAAYRHPSRTVTFNAQRILHERVTEPDTATLAALRQLAAGADEAPAILALWSLARFGKVTDGDLTVASSAPVGLRRNVFLVAESLRRAPPPAVLAAGLDVSADARVQLAALRALGAASLTPESAKLLLDLQPKLTNEWAIAAAGAAAAGQPGPMLLGLLGSSRTDAASLGFAERLCATLSPEDLKSLAPALLDQLHGEYGAAAPLSRAVARGLATRPRPDAAIESALERLVLQPGLGRAAAAAPLVRTWAPQLTGPATKLAQRLAGESAAVDPADRAAALAALRGLDAGADKALAAVLAGPSAAAALTELRRSADPAVADLLIGQLGHLHGADREQAFGILLDRAEFAQRLVAALEAKRLSPLQFSPYQRSRLTGHANADVAKRAEATFRQLSAGTSPAKDELIARLLPEMTDGGDPAKGKVVFQQACALCHQLEGVGHVVGPTLMGIGSHPAGDLLVHIIDPNRTVDDEHRAWSIDLKSGAQMVGLVVAENTAGITVRLPGGIDMPVANADIVRRAPRAASLMPEGYEGLGAPGLRDLIAYLRSLAAPVASGTQVGRHFLVDLTHAVTADSREGIYIARQRREETLRFRKFGDLTANGVPYRVIDPAAQTEGKNLVVLKGGPADAYARGFPNKVEIPVGIPAHRLHMLGAVGGWASAGGGNLPAMTVEIIHTDGKRQVVELRAARDFADYISPSYEAKGSRRAEGLLVSGQVRTLRIDIASRAPIDRILLRSHDNTVVPTTAALTLETEPPAPDEAAPPAAAFAPRKAGVTRVLLAGAGGSHDFERFFLRMDGETLRATGRIDPLGVADAEEAARLLPEADVIVLSANRADFGQPTFQRALNAFADAGKGVVALHPAVWYNWPDSSGYNRRFVSGGSRSHGLGTVTVRLTGKPHPVVAGLPATFAFHDESYHVELEKDSKAIVLAENDPDNKTRRRHPSVWIVPDPKARIVCISLGHDAAAHESKDYQRLLTNAVEWVAGR